MSSINQAAIVGSRQVSPLAKDKTDFIVEAFATHNYGIISGLALGIDTMAHEAALKYNLITTAIIPTSIDNIYPKENIPLASQIIETGGTIISEQAPNYAPVGNPFVLRNRIIAALSKYLIPVEMGKDSGTMHAVHYAVKYGRKLILCMPATFEIDHFLSYYDGIIIAAKKYRTKKNAKLIMVRKLNSLSELLANEMQSNQSQLYK